MGSKAPLWKRLRWLYSQEARGRLCLLNARAALVDVWCFHGLEMRTIVRSTYGLNADTPIFPLIELQLTVFSGPSCETVLLWMKRHGGGSLDAVGVRIWFVLKKVNVWFVCLVHFQISTWRTDVTKDFVLCCDLSFVIWSVILLYGRHVPVPVQLCIKLKAGTKGMLPCPRETNERYYRRNCLFEAAEIVLRDFGLWPLWATWNTGRTFNGAKIQKCMIFRIEQSELHFFISYVRFMSNVVFTTRSCLQ